MPPPRQLLPLNIEYSCSFLFELRNCCMANIFIGTRYYVFFVARSCSIVWPIFAASHLECSQYNEYCVGLDEKRIQMWNVKRQLKFNGTTVSECMYAFTFWSLSWQFCLCDSPHFTVIDSSILFTFIVSCTSIFCLWKWLTSHVYKHISIESNGNTIWYTNTIWIIWYGITKVQYMMGIILLTHTQNKIIARVIFQTTNPHTGDWIEWRHKIYSQSENQSFCNDWMWIVAQISYWN